MKIKSTLRFIITPVRMTISKITNDKNSAYATSQQIHQAIKSLWEKKKQ